MKELPTPQVKKIRHVNKSPKITNVGKFYGNFRTSEYVFTAHFIKPHSDFQVSTIHKNRKQKKKNKKKCQFPILILDSVCQEDAEPQNV